MLSARAWIRLELSVLGSRGMVPSLDGGVGIGLASKTFEAFQLWQKYSSSIRHQMMLGHGRQTLYYANTDSKSGSRRCANTKRLELLGSAGAMQLIKSYFNERRSS